MRVKRGHNYYQVGGMHGKLERRRPGKVVKRTVSVREIEFAEDRIIIFARVDNICCIDGLTSIQRKNTAKIIKVRAASDILSDSQLLNLHNQQWRGLCTFKCF